LSLDIPPSSPSSSTSKTVSNDDEFLLSLLTRCLSVLSILQTVPSLREMLLAGDCSVLINRCDITYKNTNSNTNTNTNITITINTVNYQ
jgi:hypothetical protein